MCGSQVWSDHICKGHSTKEADDIVANIVLRGFAHFKSKCHGKTKCTNIRTHVTARNFGFNITRNEVLVLVKGGLDFLALLQDIATLHQNTLYRLGQCICCRQDILRR